ncbi:MAG: poly-gamma-glutamate system protein [Myxococcales bacterium]|nr:MAG: poly-gamma-glutamate system protein [Myxococcales bacterium]
MIILSASASQFGANLLDLLWPDMEKVLYDKGIFEHRSVAASIGGIGDSGKGLPKKGLKALYRAVQANDLTLLQSESLSDGVDQRMQIYYTMASGRPIKAYINVGGGSISVGKKIGKQMFASGMNKKAPPGVSAVDGVMSRFIESGVPVIHMYGIKKSQKSSAWQLSPLLCPRSGRGISTQKKLTIVG